MKKSEIETIVRAVAQQRNLECRFPLEVFGMKSFGVRYRYPAGRVDDMIPKATFAVGEGDDDASVRAKAATAADALYMKIQTGWNKIEPAPAPLDMKANETA